MKKEDVWFVVVFVCGFMAGGMVVLAACAWGYL